MSREKKLTKDVIDRYAKSAENLYVAQTFKANFERDPEQKKNLSYIVKHKVDGTVKNILHGRNNGTGIAAKYINTKSGKRSRPELSGLCKGYSNI